MLTEKKFSQHVLTSTMGMTSSIISWPLTTSPTTETTYSLATVQMRQLPNHMRSTLKGDPKHLVK
jgi:hypothetical protein